jgi:alpha-acetolactate decarboxylase
MSTEQFDIETLKHIRNKLDYIYFIAKSNYNDNPELMDTIENLAQVANMFTTIKIKEISKQVETTSPQGYILSKLSHSYSRMKEYEKQKETDFPSWKL